MRTPALPKITVSTARLSWHHYAGRSTQFQITLAETPIWLTEGVKILLTAQPADSALPVRFISKVAQQNA